MPFKNYTVTGLKVCVYKYLYDLSSEVGGKGGELDLSMGMAMYNFANKVGG